MPKITKNTLLKYIPCELNIESTVNTSRIFEINDNPIKEGSIVYLCERELRMNDNFALQFALTKSKKLNQPLKIIYPKISYEHKPKQLFIEKQLSNVQTDFSKNNLDFEIIDSQKIEYCLKNLNPSILIIDFNPILDRTWLKNLSCKTFEIDSHNILPARFISNKQEYNAATFRRKIYFNIYEFLTEFQNQFQSKTEADEILADFIGNKLSDYTEFKNNPNKNVLSGLSKYLNLGFISAQRVAIEVIKSDVSDINKEAFLEELIIRKELADNFCLYCKNFKTLDYVPDWAKESLNSHKRDFRQYIYDLNQFKSAQTHDNLWNAAQNQLVKEGTIHGYLRMYWAKKIAEWSSDATTAIEIAIYLNDKYAYDAPSANGYVGILWAIGGLHDRAFKNSPVTGKIRRMTFNSIKTKFNLQNYISKYNP